MTKKRDILHHLFKTKLICIHTQHTFIIYDMFNIIHIHTVCTMYIVHCKEQRGKSHHLPLPKDHGFKDRYCTTLDLNKFNQLLCNNAVL